MCVKDFLSASGVQECLVVQSLSHIQFFATPWTAASQAPLSFTISQSLFNFMSVESMVTSSRLILYRPLLVLPLVFPSIRIFSTFDLSQKAEKRSGSFLVCRLFASGGQSIGALASASVVPMNIWDLFPLGLTDLLAVQGTLKSSPAPWFESINSSSPSLLYGPMLTSIHDYWKNRTFDFMDLCQQSDVSAF